jgi:hypothetical protein
MEMTHRFMGTTKTQGLFASLKAALKVLFKRTLYRIFPDKWIDILIYKRQSKVSKYLLRLFDSTVHYGPFKGLKLLVPEESSGILHAYAAVLLGIFEKEVLESLQNIPPEYKTFINLGAGAGYYAIGVLASNLYQRAYCFEISQELQEVILANAKLNNVSDRLVIRGIADSRFYDRIEAADLNHSVIFADIEGTEFEIFNKQTFKKLNNCIFIIEIHDFCVQDGTAKLERLMNNAKDTHVITEMTTAARDLSQFPELKNFSDTDRWLICSDMRQRQMTWLRLDPRICVKAGPESA